MNGWSQDASSVHYTNNGAYNHQNSNPISNATTPSATNLYNQNGFDGTQFQATQFQQRLHDNTVHLQSFQNSPYQVNSVIPSKRPRPGDDTAPSPRLNPLNHSGQYQAPAQYQHLRHAASSTATPSPVLPDGHFRAPGVQRFQNLSPNPYSPTANNLGRHTSPQPDQFNRGMANAMQGNSSYGQTMQMGQGFNPAQTNASGMASMSLQGGYSAHAVQLSQNLQQRQQDKQREYQMRLQHNQQQLQASNLAARHQATGVNTMGATMHGQQPQYSMVGSQGMQQSGNSARGQSDQFLKAVSDVMRGQGRPFDPVPVVCGRAISLPQLFSLVVKNGGSTYLTQSGKWPLLSASMNFDPRQFPTAVQELRQVFDENLALYEMMWSAKKQRLQAMQQRQMSAMGGYQSQVSTQSSQGPSDQMQQFRQPLPTSSQSQPAVQTPSAHTQALQQNGYLTPQSHQTQSREPPVSMASFRHRSSLSQEMNTAPSENQQRKMSTPDKVPAEKPNEHTSSPDIEDVNGTSIPKPHEDTSIFRPSERLLDQDSYGGLRVDVLAEQGRELAKIRPNVPEVHEMGMIDIQALTLSLQSGLHAEVRLALDHLVRISKLEVEGFVLDLQQCEELVDALVDCGGEQLDFLADHAAEVSDVVDLDSFEDVLRESVAETKKLQDIPDFGTLDYELDRAVDRLVAVTTIIRNLSCLAEANQKPNAIEQSNQTLLAEEAVITFISSAIRHVGTRYMFLRRQINTQDFMKDILIFLSNTADKMEVPSKEDALALLHFLLSFAPSPPPQTTSTGTVRFSPFQPHVHVYLPPAVESLAKLLARDDPNRSFYKAIFQADAATSHSELLTRAFALAVSMVPPRADTSEKQIQKANVRLACLAQGILAADILATLIPKSDHPIARTWLESDDGFASSLLHLIYRYMRVDQRMLPSGRIDPERNECISIIVHRGLSMLKRLLEKSDDLRSFKFPIGVRPRKEQLLHYLMRPAQEIDQAALRQLCALARIDK